MEARLVDPKCLESYEAIGFEPGILVRSFEPIVVSGLQEHLALASSASQAEWNLSYVFKSNTLQRHIHKLFDVPLLWFTVVPKSR